MCFTTYYNLNLFQDEGRIITSREDTKIGITVTLKRRATDWGRAQYLRIHATRFRVGHPVLRVEDLVLRGVRLMRWLETPYFI
jgi:hypothetical protein